MQSISLLSSNASLGQQLFSLHWGDKDGQQVGRSKMLAFISIKYLLPMLFRSSIRRLLRISSFLFKISFLLFSPIKPMGAILEADFLGMQMKANNGLSLQGTSTYEVLNRQLIWTTFTDSIGYFVATLHSILWSRNTVLNCICNVQSSPQKPLILGKIGNCGHVMCFLCSKRSTKCRTCNGAVDTWTRIR